MRPLLTCFAVALFALAGCAQTAAPVAVPAAVSQAIAPGTVPLQVSADRSTTMTVWAPEQPRGVVLFSTGHGSWPERYQRIVDVMTSEGFVVLAPLHVDSVRYPERDKFNQMQSLPERGFDLKAAAAYAAQRYPELPVIAAGHSYGSLLAMAEGGALANIMPLRVPAVQAVLAFSTPGKIPGLISERTYASMAVPLFEITGTQDMIPSQMGYASEPTDHLMPVETSPATAYGLVVDGADHGLVDDEALLPRVTPAVRLFLNGYGLNDPAARRALTQWQASGTDRFIAHERSQ